MHIRRLLAFTVFMVLFFACKEDRPAVEVKKDIAEKVEEKKVIEFGFDQSQYEFKRDTIKKGDTFGIILERHNIGYPKIFQIADK
ncbi:MAG: hypothetical protein AAFX55_14250 [Bacteroidota bacterium]